MVAKSKLAARHLTISPTRVSLTFPQALEQEFSLTKSRQLDDEIRYLRQLNTLQPSDNISERIHINESKSKLWKIGGRKMVLSLITLADGTIAEGPAAIKDGLRVDWAPVFPKLQDPLQQRIAMEFFPPFVPDWSASWASLAPPQAIAFSDFAARVKPSGTGDDSLCYAAWETPQEGRTLQDAFFLGSAGHLIDTTWNNQILVFVPQRRRGQRLFRQDPSGLFGEPPHQLEEY